MADFAGAKAAIRERLETAWASRTPLAWPNSAKPDPVDGQGRPIPWAYVEITGTDAGIHGVGEPGNHVVIDDGLITATVFGPADEGDDVATSLAVEIGEIFRVKQFYDAEPGTCVRTWTPRMTGGDSGSDDGMWFGVSVIIPFQFWHRA